MSRRLNEVTGATIRRWIAARALDIGDEHAKLSAKLAAAGEHRMADFHYAKAEGAWEVVKAIQLGSFVPRPVRGRRVTPTKRKAAKP